MRPLIHTPAELAYLAAMHKRYGAIIDERRKAEIKARLEEIKQVEENPFFGLEAELLREA